MTLEEAEKCVDNSEKATRRKEYLDEKFGRISWKMFGCVVVVCFIITRFIQPVFAVGESMEPTIMDGSLLLCDVTVKEYHIDDIVLIMIPNGTPFRYQLIKRIVAGPGDSVEIIDGELFVNGIKETRGFERMEDPGIVSGRIVLGENEYFVLGDNRNHSSDSREYGLIQKDMIRGILSGNGIRTDITIF